MTQEVDFDDKCDTVARICSGSYTGILHESNLSPIGAWSQWLTSLLFSDSLQTSRLTGSWLDKRKYNTRLVLHQAAITVDSQLSYLKHREGMCLPCLFLAVWTWCFLLDTESADACAVVKCAQFVNTPALVKWCKWLWIYDNRTPHAWFCHQIKWRFKPYHVAFLQQYRNSKGGAVIVQYKRRCGHGCVWLKLLWYEVCSITLHCKFWNQALQHLMIPAFCPEHICSDFSRANTIILLYSLGN